MEKKNHFFGCLILTLTAFIWGTAFVAQSKGMDDLGPFTFNGTRSLLSALSLFVFIIVINKSKKEKITSHFSKKTLIGGIILGMVLFIASSLQQIGIQTTSSGKTGFITALYIVFVPLLGIFMKKKMSWIGWLSILIAIAGFYFLCINDKMEMGKGELLILIGAIFFAVQIMLVDYYIKYCRGVELSCIQFLVVFVFSIIPMTFEKNPMQGFINAMPSLLYAGVLSGAVAYTLQIVGQKKVEPVVASLILGLESVFAAISGAILLKQFLTIRELGGCILIFIAILLIQLPTMIGKKENRM